MYKETLDVDGDGENETSDMTTSYYYDGFDYSWNGQDVPDVDQDFIFRVKDLELENILKD